VQKNQRSDPLLKTLKIKRFYKKRRLRRGGTNEEGRGGGGLSRRFKFTSFSLQPNRDLTQPTWITLARNQNTSQ